MPRTRKDRTMKNDQGQVQSTPVIDSQELEAFRATLPTYRQYETFRFMIWSWDIVKALYLLQKYERATGRLLVASAARAYGLDKPIRPPEIRGDGTVIPHDDGIVTIDPIFAMSAQIDRERPVILALVQLPGHEEPTPLLIDGLNRLYRAAQDQQEAISCYALSQEEEQLCRL